MYVVLGAAGNTGSVVAERLLDQKKNVRVVGRSQDSLQRFVSRGAEAVAGNVEHESDMLNVFSGATAAYVMIPPNFATDDFRAYQKRAVAAIAAALKAQHVKHVVTLSSVGAQHPLGTGPVAGLHEMEQALNAIPDLNVLHLRAAFFMENALMNIPLVKNMGINGMPLPGNIPIPMIAAKDIGEYAARRLTALDFSGKGIHYLLGQRDVSLEEVTRVFGTAVGRPEIPYVQFSFDDAEAGMRNMGVKPDMAALYVELYKAAGQGMLQTDPRNAESTTATSIEDFSKVFAQAYQSA